MISKILKIIAIVLLVAMPYSGVLSQFSPYETTHTFKDFLIASLLFALISLLLGWFVSGKNLLKSGGLLFFILGLIVAPPLMLGIPETSPKLLERTTEEHFRYGILILATFVFATGFVTLLKKHWSSLSNINKLILVPFFIAIGLMLWDNYSSYNFSNELKTWIDSGQKPADFFTNYDFQELYRTFGRTLAYIATAWLAYILLSKKEIKKWQFITLSVFCFLGLIFFFIFNVVGFQFYFPFMIPAIVLAPAYWMGMMLLLKKAE